MEKIKTKNSESWIEENVIMIRMWGEIDEGEVKKIAEATSVFNKKIKGEIYIIVDLSDIKRTAPEARRFLEGYSLIGKVAKIALIYKNPVAKIIASFF